MTDQNDAQEVTPDAPTTRKRSGKRALPAAVKSAQTGADLARALNVPPKAFRAWLRRQGTHISTGDKLTPAVKAKAVARYSK